MKTVTARGEVIKYLGFYIFFVAIHVVVIIILLLQNLTTNWTAQYHCAGLVAKQSAIRGTSENILPFQF